MLLLFHLIKGPCFQEEIAGELFYSHLMRMTLLAAVKFLLLHEQMQGEISGRKAAQRLCYFLCLSPNIRGKLL